LRYFRWTRVPLVDEGLLRLQAHELAIRASLDAVLKSSAPIATAFFAVNNVPLFVIGESFVSIEVHRRFKAVGFQFQRLIVVKN
jgi:hypothetical protein